MNKLTQHLTHARALLADISGAPDAYIPRREALVDWLGGFVFRAQASGYALGETEAQDLSALDEFLRVQQVPVAGLAAV